MFWFANFIPEFKRGLKLQQNICKKNKNHFTFTCWQRKCKLWFSVFNLSHSSLRDVKFDKNCSASYEIEDHGLHSFSNFCTKFYFNENRYDCLSFALRLVYLSSINLKAKSLKNLFSIATYKNSTLQSSIAEAKFIFFVFASAIFLQS